jgi:hypothetical protein
LIEEMMKVIKLIKCLKLANSRMSGVLITISVASAALVTIIAPLGAAVVILGIVRAYIYTSIL